MWMGWEQKTDTKEEQQEKREREKYEEERIYLGEGKVKVQG